jgi:hypothetical protein
MVPRTVANAVGCAIFVAPALALWAMFPEMPGKFVALLSGLTLALLAFSYRLWLQWDTDEIKWERYILLTVALGFGSLVIDIIAGQLIHPEEGLLVGTVFQPMFLVTPALCPLATTILLAGWARRAVFQRLNG